MNFSMRQIQDLCGTMTNVLHFPRWEKKVFGGRFIRYMAGMKNKTDLLLGRDKVFNPQNSRVTFARLD